MENFSQINGFEEALQHILANEQLSGADDIIRRASVLMIKHWQREKKTEKITTTLEIAAIAASDIHLGLEPILAILLMDFTDYEDFPEQGKDSFDWKFVSELISGLHKMEKLDKSKYITNAENFIKLMLTLSDDIRVILIRLAFQLFHMRYINKLDTESRRQVCGETETLFIPIAHRIGFYTIKTELEDLMMKYIDPETYQFIETQIAETQKTRDRYVAEFIHPIQQRLLENHMDCEIKSRLKSISSIHRKMQVQKVEFKKVYDVFAIRIIINKIIESEKADCWKVYSLITDIFTPNPKRLRDWISFPKSSGYESLHTTVIGPEGKWIEVQIRTRRMDELAEKSAAAHWRYKSGSKKDETAFYKSLRELLEQPASLSGETVISREKRALYTDEIFIFTPAGDLKRLKAGYTVLDFAFEIHTGMGATCTGAIVNGKIVPLKHILKNGDTVKILTSKNQKPNRDWLDFVKSPRVIAKIKHALKMETYKESEWGKEIIKNKVTQLGMEFTDPVVNRLVDYFECSNFLELYQRFGEGKLDPLKIKKALTEKIPEITPVKEETFPERVSEVLTGKRDYIIIDKHLHSVHYQFAGCCKPVPGDPIFAFVSVTKGIKVHKTNCSNARQLITKYPYRILEARWKERM
jgi:GTP pyrophosphokinase